MIYRLLVSLALGTGIAAAGTSALAQTTDDQKKAPVDVTKPIGSGEDKAGDKSADPLSSGSAGKRNASFSGLDINMDNKLSRDEIKADNRLTADFDKFDKDRNGSLSDSEFAAFESNQKDNGKNKAEDKGQSARDKARKKGDKAEDKAQDTVDPEGDKD